MAGGLDQYDCFKNWWNKEIGYSEDERRAETYSMVGSDCVNWHTVAFMSWREAFKQGQEYEKRLKDEQEIQQKQG